MTADWIDLGMITDVLDVLDQHGYARSDTEHVTQAILLISDLAHIYEGSQDHPFDPSTNEIPAQPEPAPPRPASQDPALVPPGEIKPLLTALDIAADYIRDRAELCADCADESCPTCETRLQDAQTYDHLHVHLTQQVEATASHPGPVGQPERAADREAGQ
jgi:hypothetical protein